ncbi:MAG: radical SAM family heme chaperone HemW [Hyphomicrobiaceae bacterium]
MAKSNPDPTGFGVYIHWPFCAAKCPYCDFNSHVRHGGVDQTAFVHGYKREIDHLGQLVGSRNVSSIFIGGGTPSLMTPQTLAAILAAVDDAWSVDFDCEITIEANPTSVEAGRLKDYRQVGVNRASLGVQALNDRDLKALGRLHSAQEALAAVAAAQSVFERTSFDLIYARPGQSLSDWESELASALALAQGHLSLYQLTIEDGTPFAALHRAGNLHVPPPELADKLYVRTQEITAAAGLPAYEISNHACPGEESRHNLLYWRYGEYVGIGPGAHGRIITNGRRIATSSEKSPENWLEQVSRSGSAFTEFTELESSEQADELLLMGLRVTEGVPLARLAELGGVAPSAASLRRLRSQGLLEADDATASLRATPRGRSILNKLVLELAADLQPA